MMRDLLPPNSTKMERILADILADSFDVPVQVGDLWNADKCPTHLLPWLAHQFSVDIWDDEWNEDIKRQAIKTSIGRHSIKGTRQSIVTALLTLGVVADVTAWHEFNAPKDEYTFEVVAWVEKQIKPSEYLMNAQLHDQINKMIDAHKSARDEYVFNVGAKFSQLMPIASTLSFIKKLHIFGVSKKPKIVGQMDVASAFSFIKILHVEPVQ